MKKILYNTILLGTILFGDTLYLTPHNCEVGMSDAKKGGHSHDGGVMTTMYQVVNMDGSYETNATYILSNLEQVPLKLNANLVSITKSKYDNYHCLVVNGKKENEFFTAITYISKNGKPSKTSPTKLTSLQKGVFEIEPILLPREHDRFTALKTYDFILKFNGVALPNKDIFIKIDDKDKLIGKSDENGKLSVFLDDRFDDVVNERKRNKPKEFVLFAKFQEDNKTYNTSFRAEYSVNPTAYWQSIPAGFGVATFGFLIGLFIYRRIKNG